MVGRDELPKHAPSLAFTHPHIGQIFIEGRTVSLWVFTAELGAGEGDAGRLRGDAPLTQGLASPVLGVPVLAVTCWGLSGSPISLSPGFCVLLH